MEDMVVPDVMNDVFLPQGRYPENFVLISLLEVCQEGGSRRGVLGGHGGFLIPNMAGGVMLNVMDDVLLP